MVLGVLSGWPIPVQGAAMDRGIFVLMMPGAPSETTDKGSPSPRPRISWKVALRWSAAVLCLKRDFACHRPRVINLTATSRTTRDMHETVIGDAAAHGMVDRMIGAIVGIV